MIECNGSSLFIPCHPLLGRHLTQCNAGYYFDQTNVVLRKPCPIGSSSTAGASSCTPCALGTYSSTAGSYCFDCLPWTFANTSGMSSCFACPKGWYNLMEHHHVQPVDPERRGMAYGRTAMIAFQIGTVRLELYAYSALHPINLPGGHRRA
jgi:hypothetical protein